MNTEFIAHPRLQHIGLTTGNAQPMIEWYKAVLGMRLIYHSDNPTGAKEGVKPKATWMSNDEVNHRVAFVEIPGLARDPERSKHHRLQHVAFEYRTLDDLLGTYVRLKKLGIIPVLPVDEGSQTALYYNDPDGNSIELNVDNYGNSWTSIEHIQNSPDFARKPLGVQIDPDKLVAAREAGSSPWDIHQRAWQGDFAPAKPYDLRVLL